MAYLVKGFECFVIRNSVKDVTPFVNCCPRVVGTVHEQGRASESFGVLYGIVTEAIESPLLTTPENKKLSVRE